MKIYWFDGGEEGWCKSTDFKEYVLFEDHLAEIKILNNIILGKQKEVNSLALENEQLRKVKLFKI